MKTSDKVKQTNFYRTISEIIKSERLVKNRAERIENELGYQVETLPMGSGGVGQVKEMANGMVRIQIGYGVSNHNYAAAIEIDPYAIA